MNGNEERRQKLIKMSSAAVFLAAAVVLVLIVIDQSQSDGGDPSDVAGDAEIERQLAGIPQAGMVLGDPDAKVTLVEFGDLQCPVCKGFAEEIIPPLIESQVRNGEARLDFRNFTILGQQSVDAGAAAVAAGEQGRGWNFVELFYRNQGLEGTDYVTDEFLTAIAEGAGVPDIEQWDRARKSQPVIATVEKTTAQAERLDLSGTPSFAVKGPGASPDAEGLEVIGTPQSTGELEEAVSAAAG
jgi:protein-disulfide isomerase